MYHGLISDWLALWMATFFFVKFSVKLHEDVVDLKMNPYIPGFCLKPLETYSEYLFDQDLNSKQAFSQKLWPVVLGCITKY